MFFGWRNPTENDFKDTEKRERIKFVFDSLCHDYIKKLPKNFDSWFNDNFGLRSDLVSIYRNLTYRIFNRTVDSKQVVAGKNGHLFLGDEYGRCLSKYRNIRYLHNEQIDHFNKNLLSIKSFLSRRNIDLYFIIAPNKHSIYPEYIPDWATKIDSPNIYDQAIQLLKNNNIKYINAKNILLNLKENYSSLLYFKTGSHWTDLGAFFIYKETMALISVNYPDLQSLKLMDFKIEAANTSSKNFDVARIAKVSLINDYIIKLDLSGKSNEVDIYDYTNNKQFIRNASDRLGQYKVYSVNNRDALNNFSLLIYRDSQFDALTPLFDQSFTNNVFVGNGNFFDDYFGLIPFTRKIKPNLVILEIVERDLDCSIYCNAHNFSPEFDENESKLAFEALSDIPMKLAKEPSNPKTAKSLIYKTDLPLINNSLIFRIETTVESDTAINIFYQTNTKPYFLEENKISIPQKKGKNIIYKEIYNYDLNGYFSIVPEASKLDCTIKGISFKSCPKDFILYRK